MGHYFRPDVFRLIVNVWKAYRVTERLESFLAFMFLLFVLFFTSTLYRTHNSENDSIYCMLWINMVICVKEVFDSRDPDDLAYFDLSNEPNVSVSTFTRQ